MGHCALLITAKTLLLLFIAVPEEDRIIHCDPQLQHRRQSLRHVRYFTADKIRAQIVHNRHSDAEQEKQRNNRGIHRQRQHDNRKHNRNQHIYRRFLIRKILRIGDDRRHAADKTAFSCDCAYFLNRIHRLIRRHGSVIEHCQKRTVRFLIIEKCPDILRKDFHRNADVRQRIIPDHRFHMRYLLHIPAHRRNLPGLHPLHHAEGKRPCPELFQKDILTSHRLNISRKICQDIIIHPGAEIADSRGNQEQHAQNQNR